MRRVWRGVDEARSIARCTSGDKNQVLLLAMG